MHYTTPKQAGMIAAYLNREMVGGGVDDIVRFTADDAWLVLQPPTGDAHIHVILFVNGNAVVAGHIAVELSKQRRTFWNWWIVGKLWRLKRAIAASRPDDPTFIVGASDDDTTEDQPGTEQT